jgi:hypothetical protein
MSLKLKTFNVLFYEPGCVRSELRIAQGILKAVEAKCNGAFQSVIMPEMVRMGVIPGDMDLPGFADQALELPEQLIAKMEIPTEEQFIFNVAPYERLGGVPRDPIDFARIHDELAPQGIAVTFFNTACKGEPHDYARLATFIGESKAIFDSTWVVTSSLREPMPEPFRALIERRAGAGNPASSAAKRLAVTTGSPCYVPIGDSIVLRTAGEATELICERLKFLRKFSQDESP